MTQISNFKYSQKASFTIMRSLLVFTLSTMFTISPLMAVEVAQDKDKKEAPKELPAAESKEVTHPVQVELKVPKQKKPGLNFDDATIAPPSVPARGSSEYYSSNPNVKLLIPVHIWGEIKEPGLHYVPIGSSVSEAISASGGPLTTASMPDVEVYHKNEKSKDVNLFKAGLSEKILANDTIVIDRSIKSDLPIYFGAISILISTATFIVLMSKTVK